MKLIQKWETFTPAKWGAIENCEHKTHFFE